MRNIFVISDTHFSHANILNFTDEKGDKIRPHFKDVQEMNEIIIHNWNKTVKQDDIIYHLGDFSFGGKDQIGKMARRLNGRKRLIMGNHDYNAKDYTIHFDKVMSWRQLGGKEFKRPLILCHYPLDNASFDHREDNALNVHGHLHNRLTDKPFHVNVCCEHTNYMPINIEDIIDGHYQTNVR